MVYKTSKYEMGGTAVSAFTEDGEPYANCSVCLVDYGYIPEDDKIVVPTYQMTESVSRQIISDIAEEVLGIMQFGPYDAEGVLIRLKEEYRP